MNLQNNLNQNNIFTGEAGSFYNYLSEGCKLCQEGAKMVLFVTGSCCNTCFYCPLSEERQIEVTYANEKQVISDEDIIHQAKIMDALGTGITGGEPLIAEDKVMHYIELLKSQMGSSHHIHLYTSLAPSTKTLEKLASAGLDEIRFHPPPDQWKSLKDSEFIRSIKQAVSMNISAGIEVPSIMGIADIVDTVNELEIFLNINELEFSDTNANNLYNAGYMLRDDISNAAAESEEIAKKIAHKCSRIHFCSSRYKDAIQLRKRLIRIAGNTSRIFDEVTEDGTIVHGVVIHHNISELILTLKQIRVPEDMYQVKDDCVDIAWWILDDISEYLKEAGSDVKIIERYPWNRGLIVETIPI
ncbi:Radical SAM domain protein [Methanosalsum zhilinae DSM 4017]|uniref:Radical SAM domain protein n=1 Tax=Methanosalsum zhilinae (strain DSM 4017 / NBRC 107636 / OCM 62 / WeN5) TaxID=679901 RepID=F7XMM4_METZD|nr:radical SAM protein [Methanosalsum zhilinae]AEH61039.1 Radical SAM domain protein [Methanosalsum zhilinae DSM 4017]